MEKPLQILELFGGVGAPRCALRNLGIEVKSVDFVEIDSKAVLTYNSIFEKELHHKSQDVRGWNLRPDVLIHGSPCQSVSIAGRREGNDPGSGTQSSLMWETIKIIEQMGEWKPKVVIWENVKGVLSKRMRKNFDLYLRELEQMGYVNSYQILNAMDFGLPQNRERVFVVSILNGPAFDFTRLKRRPMNDVGKYLENLDEPQQYKVCPSMLDSIGQKKPGSNFQGYCPVIDTHVNTISTAQDRTPNAGVIKCKNGEWRVLTERECWRLQGFTDEDFDAALKANPGRKGKKNGTLYKQAGNSMPIPVLESLFSEVVV